MCSNGSCGCGCGAASITLPVGPTGASTPIYVSNTVFVSKLGSDASGAVQRLDLPFLTIGAAITAALTLTPASTKRVSIVVFGGTYTENITIANSWLSLSSFYDSPTIFNPDGYNATVATLEDAANKVFVNGTITVTADNIDINGINCLTLAQNHTSTGSHFSHIIASTSITTTSTVPNGHFYDVHSDIFLSLPSTGTLSGYYEKCTGGSTSFAGNSSANAGNISGTLIDCVGTTYSFSSANANTGGEISGKLVRCIGIESPCFASSSSGTAGTISGTLEDCTDTSGISFASSSTGNGGTLEGTFIRCRTEGDKSFGYGVTGGELSGTFIDCIGFGNSFGSFLTTGSTLSGDFINCKDISPSTASFGSTAAGSGATLSGNFENCTSFGLGFGAASTGTAGILSGKFNNCTAYTTNYCFASSVGGTGGVISGTLTNCKGGGHAFCSSDTTGGTVSSTGQLINCTAVGDIMLRKAIVSGKIVGARINSQTANEPAIIVATGATLSKSDFKGNGSATSVHSAGATSIAATFLRTFGKGFHTNVTNLVTTPWITDDSNDIF